MAIAVIKQPGRGYGPPPRAWAGAGPRAEPLALDQLAREDRYRRQTGRRSLTPRQWRRIKKKVHGSYARDVARGGLR